MFDKQGDCHGGEDGPDGLFYQDTRFLSGLALRIGGMEPLLLGSVVLDDNGAMIVDLANADLHDAGRQGLAAARFDLRRRGSNSCAAPPATSGSGCGASARAGGTIPLEIAFDADFADLFEVRGERRPGAGRSRSAKLDERTVRFTYLGLDDVQRLTTLHFDPAPDQLDERLARWDLDLDAASGSTS